MAALPSYERGGPNDPTVAFEGLRAQLALAKEELSPWGWRAYCQEFRQRQEAERRLRALSALPDSGSEPKDGIVKGTPMWVERLDHLLLVEHLKTKIMVAHNRFNDCSEFFLKCYTWLVKDYLLADLFITFITTVPESVHDRVDYLQSQLEESRKEAINIRHEFEDYIVDLRRKREDYVQKTMANFRVRNKRMLYDDIVISWSFRAQREQVLALRDTRNTLEARVFTLESDFASKTEELEESRRMWTGHKLALEQDRDMYKKKWQQMVKAHQQAIEDLKRTEGTAEGQKQMILVLSQEKSMLEHRVEELEDDKRRMTKMIADLREELAKMREECRRLVEQAKDTEQVLLYTRMEVGNLEERQESLEVKLDELGLMEATHREAIHFWQQEAARWKQTSAEVRQELADEQQARANVEAVRDGLLDKVAGLEAKLVQVVEDCRRDVQRVNDKAAEDLRIFKETELKRVEEEFNRKTEAIMRRNDILEREVAVGDTVGPHLQTLRPLGVDESILCSMCKRAVVFEGAIRN